MSAESEPPAVSYSGQDAFEACANGDFPLVVLLWGMALPMNQNLLTIRDDAGNNLLHYSASTSVDHVDTIHFLLQQLHMQQQASGSSSPPILSVDETNEAGETPSIRAAHAGNLRVLDCLLRTGRADPFIRDKNGDNVFTHAAAQGHLPVLQYLYTTVATVDNTDAVIAKQELMLQHACMSQNKALVYYLVHMQHIDPNKKASNGISSVELVDQLHLEWPLSFFSSSKQKVETLTEIRQTRPTVLLTVSLPFFIILSFSYYLPWYIALPLLVLILSLSLYSFRQGGHHHPNSSKPANIHASKRNTKVHTEVSLVDPASVQPSPPLSWMQQTKRRLKSAPEIPVGVWSGWMFLFTAFYLVVCLDDDYADVRDLWMGYLIALGILEGIFLLVWIRLCFYSDPGIIRTFPSDFTRILHQIEQGTSIDYDRVCRTCYVFRPVRSKHCSQCNVCIGRLDHHCVWINRCVGVGNHVLFLLFLFLHMIVLAAYIVLVVVCMYHLFDTKVMDIGWQSVWNNIPWVFSSHLEVLVVGVWSCIALCGLAILTYQQVRNICTNMTVNEQMNWRRYAYMKDENGAFNNTMDKGCRRNVQEFFGSGDGYVTVGGNGRTEESKASGDGEKGADSADVV